MSNQTTTPSEQPASAETTTIPTTTGPAQGEKPLLEGDLSVQIASLSPADLMAVLEGREPEANPAPEFQAAPAPTETNGEQPAATTEAEPAATTDPQAETKVRQRLSVRALPVDQQIETAEALQMVRDGKAADLLDALTKIRGIEAGKPAKAESSTETQAAEGDNQAERQGTPSTVQEIESKIADLRAQRKQAKADFDVELEDSLTTEIEDLIAAKQEVKANAAVQQAANLTYDQGYQAAVDELEQRYPDTLDDNSVFSQLLDDRITAARVKNDPALADPRFILKFADDIARVLQPASPRQTAQPPPAPARAPLGSTVAPSASPTQRMTIAQARQLIASVPLKDLQAVAFTE